MFGRINNDCSSLFLLKILPRLLGSLNPVASFAAATTAGSSLLRRLARLVLDFLLKFLHDLFLAISIVIVLIVVIVLKAGEKFSFQGSIVARLGVRWEAALRVALLGQNCGFLQLLQLFFIQDREVLSLNIWLLII